MPDEPRVSASPWYAVDQLQRAVDSLKASRDAGDVAASDARIARWRAIVEGMTDGSLAVGSRTPVARTPAWVTLEVAAGGFATGQLLAETPPDAAERDQLARLPAGVPGVTGRERVNLWFLGDAGQDDLLRLLTAGQYQVQLPEEAALPVVAWLLEQDQFEAALDLVSDLRPWMARLRFTPHPAAGPVPSSATVRVQAASAVTAALNAMQPRPQITVMRERLGVWHPLSDRLVALWCDTVEGDLPHLIPHGAAGMVAGGWPCRRWPADWAGRRRGWLADYHDAAQTREPGMTRRAAKGNFARLVSALEACEAGSGALSGREVGWIRRALANTITRHGAPGSPARATVRAAQQHMLSQPAYTDLARVLAARLAQVPPGAGIGSVEEMTVAVAAGESAAVPAGTAIPPHLAAKASRALEAPPEVLIGRRIISSAEVLAGVVPQMTAQALAAGFDDPQLSQLYGQAYAAFRRRRSVLLLNLEHQVRFSELPWIAALQPFRSGHADAAGAARQALTQVTYAAIRGFPQTILPNPLIAELSTLAARAGLSVPLTEEVAADIFTGTFTSKWAQAAATASRLLSGTLYARYYDLPAPHAWPDLPSSPDDPATHRSGRVIAADFAALCAARARQAHFGNGTGSAVAVNGTILEQSQILTTHNLAILIDALDLHDHIAGLALDLADRALAWVIRRLQQQPATRRAALQAIKNAAYAWRQAIYFLSLCPPPAQTEALARLRGHIHAAGPTFGARFRPAADGLAYTIGGGRFDTTGRTADPGNGRRFLGWITGPHWLLSPDNPSPALSRSVSN
jgi:hypothetical protein